MRRPCRSRYVATFLASRQQSGTSSPYNVVPMPSITAANGKQVIPTGGGSLGWCLAPGQTHNALALAFLKYLFSPAGQVVAEKTFGVVPAEPVQQWPDGRLANSVGWTCQQFRVCHRRQLRRQSLRKLPGTVFTLSNTDVPAAVTAATTGHESIAKAFTNLQNQMLYAYTLNG